MPKHINTQTYSMFRLLNNLSAGLNLLGMKNESSHINSLIVRLCSYSGPTWIYPDIKSEIPEVIRTSKELGINYERLLNLIESSSDENLINLTPDIWKNLENTDSWETNTLDDAKNFADKYDKDIDSIISGFINQEYLPAPIVLSFDNRYYLVGGNTRLMASKALNVMPKILLIKI